MIVRKVCAWCRTTIGLLTMTANGDSHGICGRCAIAYRIANNLPSTKKG